MVGTARQQRLKGAAAGTSSGLSMIGSVYILGRYWYARRMKARASPASMIHRVDVTKELIHVLAWLDLIGAVGRVFGVLPTQTFDQTKGEPVTGVCRLQAYVITFGDTAPIAWNFVMALNLFRWVCMGEDQQMLQRKIKWYVLLTLAFTLAIDTLALAFGTYGDAGLWCWIVIPGDRERELYWKLGALYVWVLLGALAMGLLLILVKIDVQKRLRGVDSDDARVAYHGVVQNLTIYILAFIACWSPAVVDRGYSAITGHDVFTLSMLHASIVPLQGFVNAVIYGKFHVWIGRHLGSSGAPTTTTTARKTTTGPPSTGGDRPSGDGGGDGGPLALARRHFGTASLFVTSFDMNWIPFPPNLEDWIPPGNDVYVFSLQHCISVQHVEQAIRRHLLRINYPMGYRSITSLAGSQFRGHSQDAAVCQIVFVNNCDIASGNFQFHAADGRLWSQRKVFKEVVGIPIRYFEASLAFVSCNLGHTAPHPSQLQTPAPEIPLATKHTTTTGLIHSFGMGADQNAVDFPYLYHHTILAGNLNYNLDVPNHGLAAAIDQAYKAECLKRATDAAVDAKLRNFGSRPTDAPLPLIRGTGTAGSGGPLPFREPANSNVPVEWNLLYFKSRRSLGRASFASSSSAGDDEEYAEVYTSTHDNLPFTLLRSPHRTDSVSTASFVSGALSSGISELDVLQQQQQQLQQLSVCDGEDVRLEIPETEETTGRRRELSAASVSSVSSSSSEPGRRAWLGFLEDLFPSVSPQKLLHSMLGTTSGTDAAAAPSTNGPGGMARATASAFAGARGESKKVSDWMVKSQLAYDNSKRKWQELLRHDELRAAMEAKEVLCGFEEPPISFLPSFPRKVGTSASYSMLTQKTCKGLFVTSSGGSNSNSGEVLTSESGAPPAYRDRILSHSLPDTKNRLRNTRYWLCEEILTSTHKPICSTYELEVDRFFAFKNTEATQSDLKAGKSALREKTDIREFKLKLINLDANIWTYQTVHRGNAALWRLRTHATDGVSEPPTSTRSGGGGGVAVVGSGEGSSTGSEAAPPTPHTGSEVAKSAGALAHMFGKITRKHSARSMGPHPSSSSSGTPSLGTSSRRGRLTSMESSHVELAPVEPTSIATVFPLPSEDVYALQRKVYEVAHSVQSGFQSSARDEEADEASLAFTNFRTVSWKEAAAHGVSHSAITKAVNGVVHVAIKIEGETKGEGGQGILCIQEHELVARAAAVIGEAEPLAFDMPLTWGGKHVGYLHGDILCGL